MVHAIQNKGSFKLDYKNFEISGFYPGISEISGQFLVIPKDLKLSCGHFHIPYYVLNIFMSLVMLNEEQ